MIELFQPYAQYRNPFTFYYAQTYPLPPPTSIVGMLQNLTGDYYDEKYRRNLEFSIHGGFESVFWNYQQLIKGIPKIGKWGDKYSLLGSDNRPLYGEYRSQPTPVYQQELFNGHLFIFIREKSDTGLLEKIKNELVNPKKVVYLGRSEDIAYIRSVASNEDGSLRISKKNRRFQKSLGFKLPTYIKYNNLPIKINMFPVYSIPVESYFKNGEEFVRFKEEISFDKTERIVNFKRVIHVTQEFSLIVDRPLTFNEYEFKGYKFRILNEFGWLGTTNEGE